MSAVTSGNPKAYTAAGLDNSVPFNWDPAGGYGVKLYYNGTFNRIYDGAGEWVVDPDAGIVTFFHHEDVSTLVTEAAPPYISFYSYTGATGLAAASLWQQVTNGIKHDAGTVVVGAAAVSDTNNKLEVDGAATFTGRVTVNDLVCTSDRRLKTNIEEVADPLTKLEGIRGVGFTWRLSGEPSYGVIADELEAQMPGSSVSDGDGMLAVNYNAAVALLIESVKKQAHQIRELQRRIQKLES